VDTNVGEHLLPPMQARPSALVLVQRNGEYPSFMRVFVSQWTPADTSNIMVHYASLVGR
jgi:hypothetical protein